MDEVVGELKTIREEQTLQSHKLSEHEDRIEKNWVSPWPSSFAFKTIQLPI